MVSRDRAQSFVGKYANVAWRENGQEAGMNGWVEAIFREHGEDWLLVDDGYAARLTDVVDIAEIPAPDNNRPLWERRA